MKRITTVAAALFALAATTHAFTSEGHRHFYEVLNGLNEAAAVVSTTGSGTFRAAISKDESEIEYSLSFKDLEGDVRQAHIHIGLPQNSGGIVLWLCDSAANPSPTTNTPECTANDPSNTHAGWVTGTLTVADVRGNDANGIAGPTGTSTTPTTAEEFAEVVALIRAGKTYVNVHSSKFAPGEIRSQINDRGVADDDHGHHDH
jgi:CHRD domain-containing protein